MQQRENCQIIQFVCAAAHVSFLVQIPQRQNGGRNWSEARSNEKKGLVKNEDDSNSDWNTNARLRPN